MPLNRQRLFDQALEYNYSPHQSKGIPLPMGDGIAGVNVSVQASSPLYSIEAQVHNQLL
jgi:hypothetical protein